MSDRQFDSQDWIEDAVDSLHASKFPYIVITGTSPGSTRIDSGMDQKSRAAFLEMIRNGEFEAIVGDHFEKNS